MKEILLAHLERYPLMQPQDVVKLLFQSEFGPGHMIKDKNMCLERLKEEYNSISTNPEMPLAEDIGNGFIRINLAALDTESLSLELLSEMFIDSANVKSGTKESFLEKLDLLKELYSDLPFTFTYCELLSYLDEYIAAGCPVVSHSETYRNAYNPAYRVVKLSEFNKLR